MQVTDDGSPSLSDQNSFIVVVGGPTAADVVLTQTAAPNPVLLGNNLICLTIVSNRGPSTVTGVVVTDFLPPGATLLTQSASQGSCTANGNSLSCSVGTLAAGAIATVRIVIAPIALGTITNTAVVTATELDPDPSNNRIETVTQVTQAIILRITISGNSLILSASVPLDGFDLQAKDNLGSAAEWMTLSNAPIGRAFIIPIDPSKKIQFYRVKQRSSSSFPLRIAMSGNNLIISATGSLAGFDLQAKENLTSSLEWITLPITPVGNQFIIPMDSSKKMQFFRVRQQSP